MSVDTFGAVGLVLMLAILLVWVVDGAVRTGRWLGRRHSRRRWRC